MPRKRRRQSRPVEEHTQLAIRVDRYDANVDAAVNCAVYAPQYAWDLDERDSGTCILNVSEADSHMSDRQISDKIEITPEMIVAGVKRLRKSLDESQQSSADAVVVFQILESALACQKGVGGNSLEPSIKQKILARSLRHL